MKPELLEAFGKELHDLETRTRADLGARDVTYIKRVIRFQRGLEVGGRALLFGSGFFAPAWVLGTASLGAAKIIENMEIGHNVMHGQYAFSRDPALGTDYEWDNVCPGDQWRHSHNYLHHTFTNVRGVDHDLGYRILRIDESAEWRWPAVFQAVYAAALAFVFQWGVALHDIDMEKYLLGERTDLQREKMRGLRAKAGRQVLKDYVLFPLLGGPFALHVLSGNLVANLARNLWAFAVIFCGHFPDGAETFPADVLEGETKAGFYLRQILGSANFDGPRWMHFLSGHLSHQIEHHLFPDLPAHRYPELAVEVRAICARYGVPYNTRSFTAQLASVARKICRLAWPSRPALAS